jgi:hypothetical protein
MNEQVFWSPGVTLEGIEKQVILMAFRFYRGNKTQCSISLGINVRTLERKLEDYENADRKQRETEELEASDRTRQLERARGVYQTPEGPRLYGSASGAHVEPTIEAPAKHAMPMPESKEVQSVLPKQASASGQARRR